VLSCGRCEICRSGLGAFCAKQQRIGVGDVPGALAEYVVVAPHETVRLPDAVDFDLGALVEPLAIGVHAVGVGRIRRGERCLVIGAGPVGLAVALWARHFGASTVIVAEPSPRRRGLATQLGATAVVDPAREALAEALQALAPEGADVVFEASGAEGQLQAAADVARFRGRVVAIGPSFGAERFAPQRAMEKEASLHFVLAYEKDDFQYTVDMLEQGRIDPAVMVGLRVGLDEAPAAFEAAGGPDGPCKVLVHPQA
jgi:(R,R)-butanediol dehydrogenase/meso-butanediol dehydrogenase/diacetyl reductase